MSKNTKKPKRQPEMFYVGKDGKRHDDGLHDEMLDNPTAHSTFQHYVMERARKRGMPESEVQKWYGNHQKEMSKKKAPPPRAELMQQILNTILHGKGIQKRIAADLAKPITSVRDDGVRYNPNWQDDIIGGPPENPEISSAKRR